jgi:hypothetical protein
VVVNGNQAELKRGFEMEHPSVTKVNKSGYLKEEPEHWGCDAIGDEICFGDDIVKDPYGEVILIENLKDYLIERLGFVFGKAE